MSQKSVAVLAQENRLTVQGRASERRNTCSSTSEACTATLTVFSYSTSDGTGARQGGR